MANTKTIEAGSRMYEVKTDSIDLYLEHEEEGCRCPPERVTQATVDDVDYNIFVPHCVARWGRPIREACDRLERQTGYKIIDADEVKYLINEYSYTPVARFLYCDDEDGPRTERKPIIRGRFGNNYYLKREVLEWVVTHSEVKQKCHCGVRNCRDADCEAVTKDLEFAKRLFDEGYVYFLLHTATLQLKIGTTVKPKKRIQAHKSANAGELKTIGVIKGSRELEGNIHQELTELGFLVPGKREWFFYSQPVAEYVDRLVTCIENYEGLAEELIND